MPKTPVDYSKTVMYKIVCKDLNIKDCYVGSTIDFTKRKHLHKDVCNHSERNGHNYYVYQFIRNNGGWNNWDMIEIEKYPCNDKNEAHKQERHWIETYQCTLNKQVPARTNRNEITKEYRKSHQGPAKNAVPIPKNTVPGLFDIYSE